MYNVLKCDIVVSSNSCHMITFIFTFGLISFVKTSLILPAIGKIVPLLLFFKDGLGIKCRLKVDMLLNQKIK